MKLNSKDIKQSEIIGEAHRGNDEGCTGENLSPELHWSDVPEGTKSFAVTVYDPDVDNQSGWWHWLLYNIPADTRSLPRGAGNPSLKLAPQGSVQGLTDLAEHGYHGVCPDEGDDVHNYRFTVYALDNVRYWNHSTFIKLLIANIRIYTLRRNRPQTELQL